MCTHVHLRNATAPILADAMSCASHGKGTLEEKKWIRPDCPAPHSGEASFVGEEIGGLELLASHGSNLFHKSFHDEPVNIEVSPLVRAMPNPGITSMWWYRSNSARRLLCVNWNLEEDVLKKHEIASYSYNLVEVMTLVQTPPDRRSVVVLSASYYTTHCGLTMSWVFRLVHVFQQKGVN